MNETLTADRVEEVLLDCLFREDEPTEPRIEVGGILNPFGFHPERIEQHRPAIEEMLRELPTEFMSVEDGGGGGWSFLNACQDRYGNQWTGLHRTMDHLFALGAAVGRVRPVVPREMWAAMPGGMPYYVVDLPSPTEARS